MKKILLALLATSSVTVFALTAQSQLGITATIVGSCASTFQGTTNSTLGLGILDTTQTIAGQGNANYSLTCTPATTITSINLSSLNSYRLKSGADEIAYTIATTGWVGYPTTGAPTTWDGIGSSVNLLGSGTPIVFDAVPTPLTNTITIGVPSINIPSSADANTGYADTLTMTTNY